MSGHSNEENLDPEDWEALRAVGYRMLDDMIDYQKTVRERPVWIPFTDKLAFLKEQVPRNPQGLEKAY